MLLDDDKYKNRAYLVDRLAISLGNKHLGGLTVVDTIEKVGLGKGSALKETGSSKFEIAVICGLAARNSVMVGLENSGAHRHGTCTLVSGWTRVCAAVRDCGCKLSLARLLSHCHLLEPCALTSEP